jgi:ribosomal protein S18 acetylase RimI-like enzyme
MAKACGLSQSTISRICSLTIFVAHSDTDELLGGLWGSTAYSYLHIELLYLPEDLRGARLGRRLMAQAEVEAIQRRCRGVWLDTFSFQARGFYERLGYTVFGTFAKTILPATAVSPSGRTSRLRKPFPDSSPSPGHRVLHSCSLIAWVSNRAAICI